MNSDRSNTELEDVRCSICGDWIQVEIDEYEEMGSGASAHLGCLEEQDDDE